MAAMDPTNVILAVAVLLFVIGLIVKWLRQTEPADAQMVRRLENRLDYTRGRLAEAGDEIRASADRCEVLAAALAFYADVDRWEGQRFVTCAEPWTIAEAAQDDDATVVSVVQASANAPEVEPNHEPEEADYAIYVAGLELAVAKYADEEHWVGREFVANTDTAPWAIAQAAHDDERERIAILLNLEPADAGPVDAAG